MARSFLAPAAILLAIAAVSCSSTAQNQKPAPEALVRTATMDITPGITILARNRMPAGFVPLPGRPPMWLDEGKQIAVAGVQNDHTAIVGFNGPQWGNAHMLAEDGAVGGKDARIVDAAPSPDGMELAIATIDPVRKQAAVIVRDLISGGEGHPVAAFDGDYDVASVAWVARFTIALALRAHASEPSADVQARGEKTEGPDTAKPSPAPPGDTPAPVSDPTPPAPEAPKASPSAEGLYLIGTNGPVLAQLIKLNCKLSPLDWGPKGTFAVGEGDAIAPPLLIDRERAKCQKLNARPPIRVLAWTHDGTAFLYREMEPNGAPAVFAYDMAQHTSRLVAVSSSAATYVDHKVLALGNSSLSFERVARFAEKPVRADLALVDPLSNEVNMQSLGFTSTPAMFADSTMTLSRRTNAVAIVTFSPAAGGSIRKIVIYSVPNKSAFMVAFGPAVGPLSVSWSPRGSYLAIADASPGESALTVIKPPH